ncbi:uncharacterized protein [Dysidea avara]|uniref:uncharacterized protein n=1 Tax=Dysidea avara TaxID=196820 RepID=UPI00331C97C2
MILDQSESGAIAVRAGQRSQEISHDVSPKKTKIWCNPIFIYCLVLLSLSLSFASFFICIPLAREVANLRLQITQDNIDFVSSENHSSNLKLLPAGAYEPAAGVLAYEQPVRKILSPAKASHAKTHYNKSLSNPMLTVDTDDNIASDCCEVAPVTLNIPGITEKLKHNESWRSSPFYAFEGGYLLYVSINTTHVYNKSTSHIPLTVHLMKGPHDDKLQRLGYWPMRGTFIIDLVYDFDNKHQAYSCTLCAYKVTGNKREAHLKLSQFISHEKLLHQNSSIYFENDTLYFHFSFITTSIFHSKHTESILLFKYLVLYYNLEVMSMMITTILLCKSFLYLQVFCALLLVTFKYDF